MPDDVPCPWCRSATSIVGSDAHEVHRRCSACTREFLTAVPGGGRPIGWTVEWISMVEASVTREETWRTRLPLL